MVKYKVRIVYSNGSNSVFGFWDNGKELFPMLVNKVVAVFSLKGESSTEFRPLFEQQYKYVRI